MQSYQHFNFEEIVNGDRHFLLARSGETFRRLGAAGPNTGVVHEAAGTDEFFYLVGTTARATDFFIVAFENQFFKILATHFTFIFIDRHRTNLLVISSLFYIIASLLAKPLKRS
jgi:hypothetical protein